MLDRLSHLHILQLNVGRNWEAPLSNYQTLYRSRSCSAYLFCRLVKKGYDTQVELNGHSGL